MRLLVVCLALSVAMLSGCADEDPALQDTDGDDATEPDGPSGNVTVPDPLHYSGTLYGVAAPMGLATTGCGPEDVGCATHSFSIEQNLTVTITLASNDGVITGAASNVFFGTDYDMTLRDADGRERGTSTNPGAEDDVIALVLEPGSYDVEIMAWNDQDGEYVLDIEFGLAV